MQRKTRYYMKYSAKYHIFHTTFHVKSRKIDYLWDSVGSNSWPTQLPSRRHGIEPVIYRNKDPDRTQSHTTFPLILPSIGNCIDPYCYLFWRKIRVYDIKKTFIRRSKGPNNILFRKIYNNLYSMEPEQKNGNKIESVEHFPRPEKDPNFTKT